MAKVPNVPDPVQAAFEKAAREFKTALKNDKLYDEVVKTRSIDDVYTATEALQIELAKKDSLRRLSKIKPYLERLRAYSGVVETFVQVKPDVLALIWGPIKLLLQWTSTLTQSLDAIINTTAEIGELLPEFKDMTTMFSQNHHIKDVLALFFQDLLDFYVVALKFFSLGRWRYFFEAMWPIQKDKIKLITSQVERHTALMRNEVRLEHIREEHDARLRALEHFERTERSNRQQEYNIIKTDVSPTFCDDKLYQIRNQTCKGTGKWLLQDDVFLKWLDVANRSTDLLWLHGIPGAGKTFLAGTVIDKAMCSHRTVFAFLSYDHSAKTTALSVLHSLMFQLASEDDQLQTVLCQSTRVNLKNKLDVATQLLQTLLSCAGPVCVVIDGIDEIDGSEQRVLLHQLVDLSNACQETRILVSSRTEPAIEKVLEPVSSKIRVDTRNAGSIQAYINDWFGEWISTHDFLPNDKASIMGLLAPLSAKAKGMFLYARIMLGNIELLSDIEDIRKELRVLPENLNEAYQRVFRRINGIQPHLAKTKCRSLLGWVSCTPTPLTIQELEQVLVVSGSDGSTCRVSSPSPIIQLCRPIIEVVDDYVKFVHFTVKEYIDDPNVEGFIDTMEATLSLTICCTKYLCQDHHNPWTEDPEFEENVISGDYRLHYYATSTWLELTERYLSLAGSKAPPPQLINALENLDGARSQWEYRGGTELEAQLYPRVLRKVEPHRPDLFAMLRNVARFRQKASTSQYRIDQADAWIALDPLVTSHISKMLYAKFDQLCCPIVQHPHGCSCRALRRHYGQQPYKCAFMSCSFCRRGFQTRTLRNSHNKHHDIPWKCDVESCHYAEIGFLSRRMRDDHLDFHRKEGNPNTLISTTNPDPDEVQPLLFDLVISDNMAEIEKLIPHARALPKEVRIELRRLAAYSASSATLELVSQMYPRKPWENAEWIDSLVSSIEGQNMETLNWHLSSELLAQFNSPTSVYVNNDSTMRLCEALIKTASMEMLSLIEPHFLRFCKYGRMYGNSVPRIFLTHRAIKATARRDDREKKLIFLWRAMSSGKDTWLSHKPHIYLGSALGSVAKTTCSLPLAQALLELGANVDGWNSNPGVFTPLYHAARISSPEAAEFIKFLLYQGANPDRGSTRESIKEQEGAKDIGKWLNMSWDELVKKAAEDRARGVVWPS
ncbi:NACHT domain protein [Ilyonectria robusta]